MKRVLFLSYYFPPNPAVGGKRIANFVSAVKKTGNDARVLTIDVGEAYLPSHVDTLSLDLSRHQIWKNNYRVARKNRQYVSAVWARLICTLHSAFDSNRVEKVFFAEAKRLIDKHRIDIVVTSGPPFLLHNVGVRLRKKLPIKWIADFRDPWIYPKVYSNPMGAPQTDRERALFYKTLIFSDRITATTKSHADYLQSQYDMASECNGSKGDRLTSVPQHLEAKVVHLQNGVDLSLFDKAVTSQYRFEEGINVGYLGDLDYKHRDPTNLIHAVKTLNDTLSLNIHLHFWCNLTNEPSWKNTSLPQIISNLGLEEYVHINPYVSFEESLDIQQKLDALIIFAFGQPFQIPAKVYEYLLSNTPIVGLCDVDSETFQLLSRHESVALVDEDQTAKIESALQKISKGRSEKSHRKDIQSLSPESGMLEFFSDL